MMIITINNKFLNFFLLLNEIGIKSPLMILCQFTYLRTFFIHLKIIKIIIFIIKHINISKGLSDKLKLNIFKIIDRINPIVQNIL